MNVAFARGQRDALNRHPTDPKAEFGTFKYNDYFEGYASGQAILRAARAKANEAALQTALDAHFAKKGA